MRTPAEHLAKFHDTVAILVKAYLNDTLQHGNCYACAVGNIVAECTGRQFKPSTNPARIDWIGWRTNDVEWQKVFMTIKNHDGEIVQRRCEESYQHSAKEQIDATGYSWLELARVEFAFESANEGKSVVEHMFNGLMAVVDVLASIHGVDLETTEAARKMFVKS